MSRRARATPRSLTEYWAMAGSLATMVERNNVKRFLRAGASRIDIGQGSVPWVVMADPEGNEFCVLLARKD
jgi:hypothetical protein